MANRYYVGTGTSGSPTGWNSTSYWSTTTGGSPGASVPGTSDMAIFDNHSGYCTTNVNVSIATLEIGSGSSTYYSDILKVGTGYTFTVSGALQVSGNPISNYGTFNLNGQTCSFGQISVTPAHTFQLTAGAATINLTGVNTLFQFASGNYVLTSATIVITDTSSAAKTLPVPGNIAGITVTRGGSGVVNISGAGTTITTLEVTGTGAATIALATGSTTTIPNLNISGDLTGNVTLESQTAGTAVTVSSNGNPVSLSYVTIKDITASVTAASGLFKVDSNSTIVSNSKNWVPQGSLFGVIPA